MHSTRIDKVLIANRGEITCRIIRTARKLGIQTVAVYSDADANAMHVALADEAYNIGPPPSQESYLRGDKLLAVAHEAKCQAIHPGYGFLSENTEFALQCKEEGIYFIGPPASAIRDMGIKSTSKAIMIEAGVPTIRGYHGEDQSDEKLQSEAEKIGFPVMIKAVRGGGGKGMRIALTKDEFIMQLNSARAEAMKGFGNSDMLLEKFVQEPRHVEVQIFGDTHGNYVYLFERDCSVQRRHQKVIEEAPAPGLSDDLRKRLGTAASQAARAVGYVGAGTVEFILDKKTHEYFFMEMNTRLQVEHPVTEMVTGTDLVEWQFKVANGEKLPLTQDEIKLRGHAFEARIYAENPDQNFLPGAGSLEYLRTPFENEDVRVETGVRQGDEISVYYDPMIAKLVVWGSDRENALLKFTENLTNFNVAGLETNVNFLMSLARHPEFKNGNVHTNFIPDHISELFPKKQYTPENIATIVLAQLFSEQIHSMKSAQVKDPFMAEGPFRLNHSYVRMLKYNFSENVNAIVTVTPVKPNTWNVSYVIEDKSTKEKETGEFILNGSYVQKNEDIIMEYKMNNKILGAKAYVKENLIHIFSHRGKLEASIPIPEYVKETEKADGGDSAVSPMPGVIDKVFVKKGDQVKAGEPLLTIIAMKMEYIIKSPKDGIIQEILHPIGTSVAKNSVLVKFEDAENEK
ncbi:hypothetical protein RUM43_000807 [Polyplax serrata]|uniref:Methylcrotonoyl-CoA carboxylase subunit alpha, mitochondrial n=1 Tax=Polyplax serrata TaxID=468196 RepID=A0AAN8SHQ9_POLSC